MRFSWVDSGSIIRERAHDTCSIPCLAVVTTFKDGIGCDSGTLRDAARGLVGLK